MILILRATILTLVLKPLSRFNLHIGAVMAPFCVFISLPLYLFYAFFYPYLVYFSSLPIKCESYRRPPCISVSIDYVLRTASNTGNFPLELKFQQRKLTA